MATLDVEILEQYLLSLTNAGSQPAIVEIMDEFGYGPERRPEARARLDDAFAAHHRKVFFLIWIAPHHVGNCEKVSYRFVLIAGLKAV